MAYGDAHAAWYDAFTDALGKDHEAEATELLAAARAALGREPATWLDVACGTGRHLAAIADVVDEVVGVDLSPQMLDVARTRLSGRVELRVADQRDLRLDRTFDVVSSLFSSIGYARDLEALDNTVAALAAHVAPGGTLLLEPWIAPDDWEDGRTQVVDVDEGDGRRAVRVLTSRREGDVSVLDAAIVSAAAGRLTVDREEHRMLLVGPDRLAAAVTAAGLEAEAPHAGPGPGGRGLIVARRPASG